MLPKDKHFGFFLAALVAILALYLLYAKLSVLSGVCFSLLFLLSLVYVNAPRNFHLFNFLWMCLGMVIGKLVSPVILYLIFFGIFTPIALITRIFGRDELQTRFR